MIANSKSLLVGIRVLSENVSTKVLMSRVPSDLRRRTIQSIRKQTRN